MKRKSHGPSARVRPVQGIGRRGPRFGGGQRDSLRYGAAGRVFNAIGRLLAVAALAALIVSTATAAAPTRPAPVHVPVLLDFGDSLSSGYGLPQSESFPAQLEARLHRDGIAVRVINGGVSGDTTAGGLARIGWALADKPDFALVELGANDALRGIDPAVVQANLDQIIRRFQAHGVKVALLGMRAPTNWGADYKRKFDRIYSGLAKAHHLPLYPFFLAGVAMRPKLNQPDGLHPNATGVAVLVERITPFVARFLRSGS